MAGLFRCSETPGDPGSRPRGFRNSWLVTIPASCSLATTMSRWNELLAEYSTTDSDYARNPISVTWPRQDRNQEDPLSGSWVIIELDKLTFASW